MQIKINPYNNYAFKSSIQIQPRVLIRKEKINPEKTTLESKVTPKKYSADIEAVKLQIRKTREEKLFDKFLNKKGKVTTKDYEIIKKEMPFIIKKAQEKVRKESKLACTPKDLAKLAINTKNYFDNSPRLKDSKYRIISIGTSPAPLGEALQNLGCEVVFMPISGINSLISEKEIKESTNLKIAVNYLKEKGVCGEKNGDTKNVLLDYCFSGRTLETVTFLLVRDNKLPYKENIWDLSLIELLFSIINSKDNPPLLEYSDEEKIRLTKDYQDDLLFSFEAQASNVPHFYIQDQINKEKEGCISSSWKTNAELFKQFDNYSKPFARAYSLCVIDEIMKLKA